MTRVSKSAVCATACAFVLLSPGIAHAEEKTAAGTSDTTGSSTQPNADLPTGDILVTARKVKERLQDVPLAITALGGEQLRRMDHIRIEDLNQLAPSTNIVVTNGHQTSFTIRGLGANPANDGLESSTGVFLDGVYLGRPGMAAMDLIDIDQVEVLRGPQGTLFGKNTTAGAINITTALPNFKPGLLAQATIGNYGYQQYQTSLTGPITDTLAGRLTAYDTTRDGDIRDITTGKRTGTIGRLGVRGQLLYKPDETLSIRLIGEYEREEQSAGALPMITSRGANYAGLLAKLAATNSTVAIDPDGLTTAADGSERVGTRQVAGSAEINWTFGSGFKLTSISAYRHWSYTSVADTEASSADVFNGGYKVEDKQFSEEIRLAIPHSTHFDAIAGLYYFGQRVDADSRQFYGRDTASWLSGVPAAQLGAAAATSAAVATDILYNGSRWDVLSDPHTDSYAAFGQGSWHLTPRWNITGGVRVTYETKHEDVSRPNPVNMATGLPIAGLASQTVAPIYGKTSDTAPSFLISTDYHVTAGVMVYGLVSRGQKAGGLNPSLPVGSLGVISLIVKPEAATNFEVGVKTDFMDHRLSLDVSLYHTNVHDYQATYLAPVNGTAVQYLTNVGNVRTQGFEAEATVRPLAGLSVHGYLGYTDATYRSYTNAPCPLETTDRAVCNLTGRPVAGAPKWTAGVNGTYEHDLSSQVAAYFSGEYSWRSHFYGSLDDSRYTLTGDYGLLNLRLGFRAKNGPWDVSFWGKNVMNRHYVANYINYNGFLPGIYGAFFGDPATYGMTLRTAF